MSDMDSTSSRLLLLNIIHPAQPSTGTAVAIQKAVARGGVMVGDTAPDEIADFPSERRDPKHLADELLRAMQWTGKIQRRAVEHESERQRAQRVGANERP